MSPFKSLTAPVVLLLQPPDDSREMYAEFFRYNGFVPVCHADAGEALTFAPSADIIVTGLQLRDTQDGYDFIARLRSNAETTHLPIIVLTSWEWQTEKLRAEDAG